MQKRSSKKRLDVNTLAKSVVDAATRDPDAQDAQEDAGPEKNPAAVALGRLGGLKGGKARAKKLTVKRRKEIASNAAKARWTKAAKRAK